MKITQDVQEFAKSKGISENQTKNLRAKAIEFIDSGAKVYRKI